MLGTIFNNFFENVKRTMRKLVYMPLNLDFNAFLATGGASLDVLY